VCCAVDQESGVPGDDHWDGNAPDHSPPAAAVGVCQVWLDAKQPRQEGNLQEPVRWMLLHLDVSNMLRTCGDGHVFGTTAG
jgi:hypothetical protein